MNRLKFKFLSSAIAFGVISAASFLLPSASYAQTTLNVPLISQLPELKNGCEVTSLTMLLRYKGINVTKMGLANQVKKDPTPYRVSGSTIYWGNPNTGFVGDITGRRIGYSVYHGPIYQLANRYTNAIDLTGQPFDVILKQLSKGKPVWVISTSTFNTVPSSQWKTIQTPTGPIRMTFHEHSVLLTGYDSNYVYFNDPLANIKNRKISRTSFLRGWEQFGRQAITYGSSRGYLDKPGAGISINETYNLSGWFLDESNVSKIEVLVDGKVVGQASYGDVRADVKKAYPDYNNGNAGFHYGLDTKKLSNGTHTITIKETGKNGWTSTLPGRVVTVSNAKGALETPVTNEIAKGQYNVKGWYLDQSHVAKIEVLVDGKVVGLASYGDVRADVKKAYPAYNNANAGYHYPLDTTKLADGVHSITVRETGRNRLVSILPTKTFTISNVRGYLDQPAANTTISGSKTISGWFLDESTVSTIDVLVDGRVVGQAAYRDARPDVLKAYPEFNNGNAGYHFVLNTLGFSNGKHTITIRETGKNGKVKTFPGRVVTISN
ncbi:C39 family peptidase [Bacillus sp. ISL-18]|uniref:C39 family peptidase n=1 Tax=Bacillus sp. ISL-18 TaxID=2819118 RepID=UPI001BE940F8|nr:C39 family peptidase [Bacillus sp. ISL-18]MBT2658811.1 C39 family peptidase [Bacillus sp. ISL-18]